MNQQNSPIYTSALIKAKDKQWKCKFVNFFNTIANIDRGEEIKDSITIAISIIPDRNHNNEEEEEKAAAEENQNNLRFGNFPWTHEYWRISWRWNEVHSTCLCEAAQWRGWPLRNVRQNKPSSAPLRHGLNYLDLHVFAMQFLLNWILIIKHTCSQILRSELHSSICQIKVQMSSRQNWHAKE